ncbi:uncharacterized protein B0I36DRAFT_367310 [Microdochium trichocladiopsis]|uniref:BTB domain-containing protein n=1 Tax=Microdochium trichocladiopsis TaxID=1682393 RepID=A0A9P8XVQ4_9PEZI|nr:uncharacterized protein B0I36DRAFT_367310 [Microdochium trichocladiopsis]KAH7020827.1 hypothetical protein B0I36DRAFT_367310 [Microdochium trichocladiopsis]
MALASAMNSMLESSPPDMGDESMSEGDIAHVRDDSTPPKSEVVVPIANWSSAIGYSSSIMTQDEDQTITTPPPATELYRRPDVVLRAGHPAVIIHASSTLLAEHSPFFHRLLFGPWVEKKPEEGDWVVDLPDSNGSMLTFVLGVLHGSPHVAWPWPNEDFIEKLIRTCDFHDMVAFLHLIQSTWVEQVQERPLEDLAVFAAMVILGAPKDEVQARLTLLAGVVNHVQHDMLRPRIWKDGRRLGPGDASVDDIGIIMQDNKMLFNIPDEDAFGLYDILAHSAQELKQLKRTTIEDMFESHRRAYAPFLDITRDTHRNSTLGCTAARGHRIAPYAQRVSCHRMQLGGFYEELVRLGITDARAYFDHRTRAKHSVEECANHLLAFQPDGTGSQWRSHIRCNKPPMLHRVVSDKLIAWQDAVAELSNPALPDGLVQVLEQWIKAWADPAAYAVEMSD